MIKSFLLILNSGDLNEDHKNHLGNITNLKIPISNTFYSKIFLNKNHHKYDKIFMTVDYDDLLIAKIYKLEFPNLEIIITNRYKTLDQTLFNALNIIDEKLEHSILTIIFGDCDGVSIPAVNSIVVGETKNPADWTYVSIDKKNKSLSFSTNKDIGNFVVTGCFVISDAKLFIKLYKHSYFKQRVSKKVQKIYEVFAQYHNYRSMELVYSNTWRDLGHRDNYLISKKSYIPISTRYMNEIKFDKKRDSIIKSSNSGKISEEVTWFTSIPKSLKKYVTHIEVLDWNSYSSEYINGPTLAELWICKSNRLNTETITQNLNTMLNSFKEHEGFNTAEKALPEKRKFLFYGKLEQRFELIENALKDIDLNNIIINGRKSMGLLNYLDILSETVSNIAKENSKKLTLIHGDLIFGNIIIEENNNIKLIDPKGGEDIFSDPLYDLCKLAQSIMGDYDYAAADIFNVNYQSKRIDFLLPSNKNSYFYTHFSDFLTTNFRKFSLPLEISNILVASLILSAIPFHSENRSRQILMFAKSMELVSDI